MQGCGLKATLGNFGEGIDMWAAVNMHDSMAKIGVHDQDTIRCGKLRGGAQRFRQPPQNIPGQWTCSLCGQERVWPTKARPTGRPSQRSPATNPTFRPNGRQSKISGQHTPPAASTLQFPTLPQQSQAEGVGANNAVLWAAGVRGDLVRDLLKNF